MSHILPYQNRMISPVVAPLYEAGFTVFYLRHPSTPRYLVPEIYEALQLGREHVLTNSSEFDDEIVSPQDSATMHESLRSQRVITELLSVDAAHELFSGDMKETADKAVVQWFAEHFLR